MTCAINGAEKPHNRSLMFAVKMTKLQKFQIEIRARRCHFRFSKFCKFIDFRRPVDEN